MNIGLTFSIKTQIHKGYQCNECQILPIKGNRWTCYMNSDLCDKCHSLDKNHSKNKYILVTQENNNGIIIPVEEKIYPVPLKNINSLISVAGNMNVVKLSQTFVNVEQNDIEAIYRIPTDPRVVIKSLSITIDDKTYYADIKEKESARTEYDDALSKGHGAYLLERSDLSKDIFMMSIGRLPPGKECRVEIIYI